jgi:hypothetical protein
MGLMVAWKRYEMASDGHAPGHREGQIEILRKMPDERKFQLWNDLIMTGRALSISCLRDRFSDAGPEELRRRLATLLLGPELAAKVYGPEIRGSQP